MTLSSPKLIHKTDYGGGKSKRHKQRSTLTVSFELVFLRTMLCSFIDFCKTLSAWFCIYVTLPPPRILLPQTHTHTHTPTSTIPLSIARRISLLLYYPDPSTQHWGSSHTSNPTYPKSSSIALTSPFIPLSQWASQKCIAVSKQASGLGSRGRRKR